jgi:hypothetical protein
MSEPETDLDWERLFSWTYERQLKREAERQGEDSRRTRADVPVSVEIVRAADKLVYDEYLTMRERVPTFHSLHGILTCLMVYKHPRGCGCRAHAIIREAVRRGDL